MRLATVQVSRVFTTGISRNKEIHLKVLIEDDSKNFVSSSIGFLPPRLSEKSSRDRNTPYPYTRSILTEEYLTFPTVSPTDSSATHIKGQWENLVCRIHAGSSKARPAQGASQVEFLREGIFRCRAGVGGQGSRAAMESP